MSKSKSPTIKLELTDEQRAVAIRSNSGGCLIADAIKEQYPHFTSISVDMATIRVTDKKQGKRYTYLTPPDAQHVLLSFDQGWSNPTEELKISRAVHVRPISGNTSASVRVKKTNADAYFNELEEKEAAGMLTDEEAAYLKKSRASRAGAKKRKDRKADRPSNFGKPKVTDDGNGQKAPVIEGGPSPVQGPDHPNLLRGRNRHFGAKMADPGVAFRQAVAEAVAAEQAATG